MVRARCTMLFSQNSLGKSNHRKSMSTSTNEVSSRKRTMSSRSFPAILSIVLSLGTLSFYLSEGSSINQVRPACLLRGWPPRTSLLLGYPIPSSPAKDKVVYHGHYCYSEKKTRWCHKPPLSYKSFDNCTSEQLTDGVKVKCNMTEFLKKLYPNYWDSSLSNQLDNTVCMVISATNKKYTNFTKKKCCNLRKYKFSPIEILSLTTPAKGQINITWRSPSDMDDSTKGFTEYIFYLSMIDTDINQTIKVFPSKPKASIFFHIIEDLQPYTKYRLTGAVFFENQDIGIQSKPMEVRTLPEAPSAPPIIVENQVMSQSEKTRTVAVKWTHPEKQKRNGIIMQTVMEYEKQTDNINETLTYYVKRIVNGNWTNATITDLIKDADYVLTLQSCTTAVDCSVRSQQITLKGIGTLMDQQPSRRSSHFTSSTVFIVIIVVVISVLCFGFLLYLVCYFKRRNRREDAVAEFPSLDPLQEDITVLPGDQSPDIEERRPDANNTNYSELQQLNPEKIAGHDQAAILQADDSAYMCLVSNSNKESQEEIPLC